MATIRDADAIIDLAADLYGIDREVLLSKSRSVVTNFPHHRYSDFRIAVYMALRELTGFSYPILGEIMGRDHSSILQSSQANRGNRKIVELKEQVVRAWVGRQGLSSDGETVVFY